jgi:Cap4 SAVED domain
MATDKRQNTESSNRPTSAGSRVHAPVPPDSSASAGLYGRWCDATKEQDGRKRYWTYVEKPGGRDEIRDELIERMRSHYHRLERIADDVKRLGYKTAAEILRAQLPQTAKGRSGDLGEILATELVEEEIGLRVPVRRLRYKDGRNMAMRGDDFIGAGYDSNGANLLLLKGEAKSKRALGRTTVESARKVLNRDDGRCTPDSLAFVANRLLDSANPDDNALGRKIRDEVGLRAVPADRIRHMLFTMSGNGPHASLREDLSAAGTNRDNYVVNLHIEDHQDFIEEMFEKAEDLGDK